MIGITGARGFVGENFVGTLKTRNLCYRAFSRFPRGELNYYLINDFNGNTDWSVALEQISTLVHIASIAHSKSKCKGDYDNINHLGTVNLANQAAAAGVKRFIFISSIGVNGISNYTSFKYDDIPTPYDEYSKSKYNAEVGLVKIAKETGMEVVIIRPPLVYGHGAPGNFGILLKVAKKNLPLPLGAINNQRSFVFIDNLVDLIITCIDHPDAANQIFLVSDDEDISTSNLLKKLTLAAGRKPWLLPVPVSLLKVLASIVGKKEAVERFSNSLTVDIEHTKKTLNWKPPITLDEGIRRCFK